MPDLSQSFQAWRSGEKDGCRLACRLLWEKLYHVVHRYLSMLGVPADLTSQVASDGFWDAVEELDLQVNGGSCLTGSGQRGSRVGLVSGRQLGPRSTLEWRGEQALLVLARELWIRRALARLRQWQPRGVQTLSLVSANDAPEAGEVSEGDLTSTLLTPEAWTLDRQNLRQAVDDLTRAERKLHRHPACQAVVQGTVLYLKLQIARCNPRWMNAGREAVALAAVETLLAGADLSSFDADGTAWRQFLLTELRSTSTEGFGASGSPPDERNWLDQRIRRCRTMLRQLASKTP